jgi:molybdate transport system permease protein
VALPLAAPGILSGVILSWARSLGEFGATIMIAGNIPGETRTVPLMVYSLLETPEGMRKASRLVLASIAMAVVALIVGEWLDRRGQRRLRPVGSVVS